MKTPGVCGCHEVCDGMTNAKLERRIALLVTCRWPLFRSTCALHHLNWGKAMTEQLADKQCVPCRGGVPPLKGKELQALLPNVAQWTAPNEHHLRREFRFPDFRQALDFVNRVGAVAEEQGHHPDIFLAWGKVEVTLWTHKINGLTESDFIMAAKIDRLHASSSSVLHH